MWLSRRCTKSLVKHAVMYIKASHPIPLDLYAALVAAGIDVTELERTTRNG